MFKKILCTAAALTMLAAAGCEDAPEVKVEDTASGTSSEVTDETVGEATELQTQEQIAALVNPLTGESGYNAAAAGKRPVAVMVNNLKDALPQYGIEQAYIVYDLPVVGGI